MGRIGRSWSLAKLSWRVLANDRSLAIFPIISFVACVIAIGAIAVPGYVLVGVDNVNGPGGYAIGAVVAFVGTFITVFFNVALVSCAARSFKGQDTTIGEGIAAARSRIGVILQWTILATTVGLVLRALEERVPLAGRIAVWLVGAVWSIVTYFVIPVLAFEEVGPIETVRRSGTIVRARWGEAIVGNVGISFVTVLLAIVVAVPLTILGAVLAVNSLPIAFALWAFAVLGVLAASVLGSTLTQIYNTALYTYASSGMPPTGFTAADMDSAFRAKPRSRFL